ncbi:protein PlyC [Paenibacillus sp. Soil766]|uniref:pectinesterase family protein n=1 Tax=Paenibacillus sp. Soil766 TaxID=1736404 RepID=UPI00070C0ACB|nr:pectinesterase family protein [Paenibacillus sp. Soil766]KRF06865.1 protein PlyC [Paenibacillus sp. Soil766]
MKKALSIGMCLLLGLNVFPLILHAETLATIPVAQSTSVLTNPTGVTAVSGDNRVDLSWNSVSGAISYKVKRSLVNGGPYETISSNISNITYTDTSAMNGTVYYYVVTAVGSTLESMISNQTKALPYISIPGAPAVPADFSATANDGSVELSWSSVPGTVSYSIKRSETSGGPYTVVNSNQTSTTYRDSSITNGKQYYYVVSAVNTNGESQNTEEIIVAPARVVTVAQDGSGDFTNITDALATIPVNNNARTVIYVKKGTYRERSIITAPYVSLVGAGQDETKIVYDLSNADMPNQAVNGATVAVSGDNFTAANLTIENDSKPSDGQALALSVNADKAVFENVKLIGYQDTLYAGIRTASPRLGRQYYHNSEIRGRTDFIYGPASAAVFDHVDAVSINAGETGGYVTAAATKNETDPGLVFMNSRLLRDSSTNGLHYLGRPWQDKPSTRYINTWMDSHIHTEGWTPMQVPPYFYGEYNSSGPGASPATRVMGTQMTAEEASALTIPRMFDGWDPSKAVIIPKMFPLITTAVAPALPDGLNGAYTKPVVVYMEEDGSLPEDNRVQYRINGGEWTEYAAEFEVGQPGKNLIEYRYVNKAGNASAVKHVSVEIDPTAATRVPAFPGAEGAAMYAKGGRGGQVYEVTNLLDYDTTKGEAAIPGSLRDAVSTGNRTVVFRISGTINLKRGLDITSGNLTIAGQTAPGDGIAISGYMVKFGNNDVGTDLIIRYLRFRNGINVLSDSADIAGNNIIVDHCSFSWSSDETFSVKNRKNFTVQWSIISDSLNQSIHGKGAHGYGGIWGGTNASYHHNLIANHNSRNPRFDRQTDPDNYPTKIDYRNNVVYNWGANSAYGGEQSTGINMINNYYKPGPSTFDNVRNRIVAPSGASFSGTWYIDGNFIEDAADVSANNWVTNSNGSWKAINPEGPLLRKYEPMVIPDAADPIGGPVSTDTAQVAYEKVLQGAGASLPKRDSLDARILNDVRNGTGRITNTIQSDGGLPELNTTPAPQDNDHDGMVDAWETAKLLNPNDPSDGTGIAGNGYTNLENYINSLVGSVSDNPTITTTNPVHQASFEVESPILITADAADNEGIAKVKFYAGDQELGDDLTAPFSFNWENAPKGEHYIYTKAIDNAGYMTLSAVSIIYVNGPDNIAPWTSQDIGPVAIAGSASLDGTTYTVKGSGEVRNGSDSFHYVYQPVHGNFEMLAYVNFDSEIDDVAKAGLMIRGSLAANSPAAAVVLSPESDENIDTSGRKALFMNRTNTGGSYSTNSVSSSTLKAPFWLKIVRNENVVSGFVSTDKNSWALVDYADVTLPDEVFVGMAVDAGKATSNSDYLTAATFTDVSFQRSAGFTVKNPVSETVNIPAYTVAGTMIDGAKLTITNNGSTVVDAVNTDAGTDFEHKIQLSDGVNIITISASSDTLGDVINTKTITVTYNKSAVVITSEIPATVNTSNFNLLASISRNASVTVKMNGTTVLDQAAKPANEPFNIPLLLQEGPNEIVIYAVDEYGIDATNTYAITYVQDWGTGLFAFSGLAFHDLSGNALSGLEGSQDTMVTVNIHNNSQVAQNGVFVIALYDPLDRKVKYAFVKQLVPGEGDKQIKAILNMPKDVTGYKVKVYALNKISDSTPISNTIISP